MPVFRDLRVGPGSAARARVPGAWSVAGKGIVYRFDDVEVEPDAHRIERAGLTKACGTGACAAVVAAHRQGRTSREVEVLVDGGSLQIEWRAGDDRVLMTGPVELEGAGELSAA